MRALSIRAGQLQSHGNALALPHELRLQDAEGHGHEDEPEEQETARERFQRVARTVLLQSTAHRWNVVLKAAKDSQIGQCAKNDRKNLQNLGRAIEEAKRWVITSR